MKRISFFLFVAFLSLTIAVPAFAKIQSVKMSGDITVRHLWRSAYDLEKDNDSDTYNGGRFGAIDGDTGSEPGKVNDNYNWFVEQVRLRTDAELTDNVSGHIELLNQRDMDGPNVGTQGSALITDGGANNVGGATTGTVGPSTDNDQFDLSLNKAYIKVKEFLYSPVTVSAGRQDYQMNDGFVIGSSHVGQSDPQNSLAADEYTMSHAFDSILASIDLNPYMVELFAAKVSEDNILGTDDEDLFSLNVKRSFSAYNSEMAAFVVVAKNSSLTDGAGTTLTDSSDIYAYGLRGSISPTNIVRLNGEIVAQFGKEGGEGSALGAGTADFTFTGNVKQDIRAFASDFRAEVDVTQVPWPTTLGIEHVFYSGEDANENGNSSNYRPLHRGKFHSAIREFQGTFYLPTVGVTPGSTNQHQFILDMAFHPFNNPDLKFFTRFLSYWFHHVPVQGTTDQNTTDNDDGGRSRHIGEELDLNLQWAYTEDLTFDILYAFFVPGSYFEHGNPITGFGLPAAGVNQASDIAQELVTSVTLNFG